MAISTSIISASHVNETGKKTTFLKQALIRGRSITLNLLYPLIGFFLLLGSWQIVSLITKGELPAPLATLKVMWELIRDPFYDYGPNDKGIALQLGSSLLRVFTGFMIGSSVAIPVGILMGSSAICRKIFYPVVQVLKPVSP